MFHRIVSLLALLALLAPSVSHAGNAEFPIVNGDSETGHPAVVSLGVQFQDNAISACTGSLITPRMVLTAGHCGAGYPLDLVVAIGQAMFGDTSAGADVVVGFDDLFQHPDYTDIEDGPNGRPLNDVGILLLAEDIDGIRPLPFRTAEISEDDHAGLEGLSVGFGSTSSEGGGSGTKRSAEVLINTVYEQFIYSRNEDHPDGGGICGGDSGGPMMFQDEEGNWVIWGIHSWGDQFCSTVSGSTRTDLFAEWILGHVESVHGTRDVCAVNGWYEDGVCDDCMEPDPDCGPVGDDDDSDGDDDDSAPLDEDGGDGDDACDGCSATGSAGTGWFALLGVLAYRRGRGSPVS